MTMMPATPPAVRELAVGTAVDDGLDRLFEQVAADDLEDPAGGYFFLEERFARSVTPPSLLP